MNAVRFWVTTLIGAVLAGFEVYEYIRETSAGIAWEPADYFHSGLVLVVGLALVLAPDKITVWLETFVKKLFQKFFGSAE